MNINSNFKKNTANFKILKLHLKNCKQKEILNLYEIFSEGVKSGFFYSKKEPDLNEHKIWLNNRLKKKDALIFLCYNVLKKKYVGYIRYDFIKENLYEISISVLKYFQSNGLGTHLIKKTLSLIAKKDNVKVCAIVKKINIKSLKAFQNNNFKIIKKNKRNIFTKNTIDLRKEHYLEYKNSR